MSNYNANNNGRGSDNRGSENRGSDNRSSYGRSSDNRSSDNRRSDNRSSYGRSADNRGFSEGRGFGEGQGSDSRSERSYGAGKRTHFIKKSTGFAGGPARPTYAPGNSSRFGSGRPKMPVKKFNPSLFIKKVEEQVVSPVYIPQHKFSDFLIAQQIKDNIAAKGYVTPTPIQDKVIPLLLEGKDVVATANTGTGKTAAFLIPLIHNIMTKKVTNALIITPTRELAVQIQEELNDFKNNTGIFSVVCIGGVSIVPQMNALRRNPAIVIGTPGRLKDLEQNNVLNFSKFNAIVLDEVDTMLDMGFVASIKYIMSKLPAKRHSLFFSATISPDTKRITDSFANHPVSVSVKTRQSAENVNQDVIKVDQQNKVDVLHDLLIKPEFSKVIIFARTKRNADKLEKALKNRGFKGASIHGDKTQEQRRKALALFKEDKVKILLATDVVARGIDIDDVSHVINFDMPQTYEDYIHRIGRTGRANKIGQALTFVD